VDGHDVFYLVKILTDMKGLSGPKLLHCITTKGKGYVPAEIDQTIWHAPGEFDIATGTIIQEKNIDKKPPRFQDVFGETIVELAESNSKIFGITPAMPTGCSLNLMMEKMPHRAFDVGIAEQHAVTFSAGLAIRGMIPFCNIYSTFAQRAYDQIIHDVALQNLHVVFCFDRAGLVGNDGATHQGAFDISYLRCIPNMVIAAPMDEIELRHMMFSAQLEKNNFPICIRYPRGRGIYNDWKKPFEEITIGSGRTIREGNDIAILSFGSIGIKVTEACKRLAEQGISTAHYDLRFVKPLDTELLASVFKKFKKILTVEDAALIGGFGSSILEYIADNGVDVKVARLGIPDIFVEHGNQSDLYSLCHYDIQSIVEEVIKLNRK